MTQPNTPVINVYRTFQGLQPHGGPSTIPLQIDFTSVTIYKFNLEKDHDGGKFPFIQGVYIDNALNTQPLSIVVENTNQTVTCPAGYQGTFPLLMSGGNKFTISCAGAASNSTWVHLLTMPVPWHTWRAVNDPTVTISGNLGNNVDNVLPVTTGLIGADSYNYGYDSVAGKWERFRLSDDSVPGFGQYSLIVSAALYATNTAQSVKTPLINDEPFDGTGQAISRLFTWALGGTFNGSSVDMLRGNIDTGTLVGLVNHAAGTVPSADQTNYNSRGVKIYINVTAISGGTTLNVNLLSKDQASSVYTSLITSSAINAIGMTIITLYPGITVSPNVSVSDILPRSWAVNAVIAGAGTVSATIGASVIL